MTPEPGQVVTVFRSRLRADAAAYAADAAAVAELARAMPGYVEHKAFTADDGERVTVVVFASRGAHDAWARDEAHRRAQQRGRDDFYAEYSISVCDEVRFRAWSANGT